MVALGKTRSHWWYDVACFDADESGLYPQARQVIAHYRGHAGLTQRALSLQLQVTERLIRFIEEEGCGLDSVMRLRQLCALLAIPPALLGLCDPPGPAGWWTGEYEPWPEGSAGWPDMCAVIKYYRRAKSWSQNDLTNALGVSPRMVKKMEKNGASLDSVTRRRALRFLLAIPPVLLGLDGEHIAKEFGVVLTGSTKEIAPEMITSFRASAGALFSSYYTGHAQDRVDETLSWLSEVREVRRATISIQRQQILEAESLGYQALANITREYETDTAVFRYSKRAVQLARESGNVDLLSAALSRQSSTYFERGYADLAQPLIQEALQLPIHDSDEYNTALVTSLRISAFGADRSERSSVLGKIDKARPSQSSVDVLHRHNDQEVVFICQAQALNNLAASAPQIEARDLFRRSSDLLLSLTPATARRALKSKLALSHSFIGLKDFEQAALTAIDALPLMDEVRSVLYLPQLASIYLALRKSTFRDSPLVAQISLYLHAHGAL